MDAHTIDLVNNRAAQAVASITNIPREGACLVTPRILGRVFQSFDYPTAPEHLGSVALDGAHDHYVGQRIAAVVTRLLSLHAQAMAAARPILAWDADRLLHFIHELPERSIAPLLDDVVDVPSALPRGDDLPVERKAFVMVEQSIRYLVVMLRQYGSWCVHVRQWFPDLAFDVGLREQLALALASQEGSTEGDAAARTIARAGAVAAVMRQAADDRAFSPGQLGLAALVRGGWAMDRLGHIAITGLRYGDGRDPGYVLSFDGYDQEVKDALAHFTAIRWFLQYAAAAHVGIEADGRTPLGALTALREILRLYEADPEDLETMDLGIGIARAVLAEARARGPAESEDERAARNVLRDLVRLHEQDPDTLGTVGTAIGLARQLVGERQDDANDIFTYR